MSFFTIFIVCCVLYQTKSQTLYYNNFEIVSDLVPSDCYDATPQLDYFDYNEDTLPKCRTKPRTPSKCSGFNIKSKLLNRPTCDKHLEFASKQCKGIPATGRCFCFDGEGHRIFGQAWWEDEADEMTCACSRRKWEMKNANLGSYYNSLHCSSNGNYEALQCDVVNNLCWCADEKTGNLISPVVPDKAITKLPCYDSMAFGTQYLRQCDSLQFAQAKLTEIYRRRGTPIQFPNSPTCDDDGAFGPYTIIQGSTYCTWRDNTTIGSWHIEGTDTSEITCNCARDSIIFPSKNQVMALSCNNAGDYNRTQTMGEIRYCVDADGYRVTADVLDKNDDESVCPAGYNQ